MVRFGFAELLRAAGFSVAKLEVQSAVRTYSSAEEVIRFAEASSFGNVLGHLPDDLKIVARERTVDNVEAAFVRQRLRVGCRWRRRSGWWRRRQSRCGSRACLRAECPR